MKTWMATLMFVFTLAATNANAGNVVLNTKSVGVFPDGTAFIILNTPISSTETSCAGNVQVRFMTNTIGGADMYRTALAAFLAGRPITVNIGSPTSCLSSFPLVAYLFVE